MGVPAYGMLMGGQRSYGASLTQWEAGRGVSGYQVREYANLTSGWPLQRRNSEFVVSMKTSTGLNRNGKNTGGGAEASVPCGCCTAPG